MSEVRVIWPIRSSDKKMNDFFLLLEPFRLKVWTIMNEHQKKTYAIESTNAIFFLMVSKQTKSFELVTMSKNRITFLEGCLVNAFEYLLLSLR